MHCLKRFTTLAILAALLLLGAAALAQTALDDTFQNELIALDYPSEWVYVENEAADGGLLVTFFANQAMLDRILRQDGPSVAIVAQPGETIITVVARAGAALTPTEFLTEFMDGTVSPADFVDFTVESSGYSGVQVAVSRETGDGYALAVDVDGLLVSITAFAAAGEVAALEPVLEAVIESLRPAGAPAQGGAGAVRGGTTAGQGSGGAALGSVKGGATSAAAATATPVPLPTIALNSTVNGLLAAAAVDQWQFEGNAGDVVTISMEAAGVAEIDTYLTLLDPNNQIVAEDDDSGGGYNAMIEGLSLRDSGTYTIAASSFDPTAAGGYTLTLSAGFGVPLDVEGDVTLDTPITASLPRDEDVAYLFAGSAGQVITITLSSTAATLDPYLILRGPDGERLAEDDDSAGSLNARIESLRLPEDGLYTIIVTTYAGRGAGRYSLLVEGG